MTNTCNSCGSCCKLFYINLTKQEYESGKFETIFKNDGLGVNFNMAKDCGANFLAKKADGSCIYLENNKCRIHTDRPNVCRSFFCNSKAKRFEGMREMIKSEKKIASSSFDYVQDFSQ